MKLVYQHMPVLFNFSSISNHLHPLQVENCGSNSRLVVDEDDNVKSGLKGLNVRLWRLKSIHTQKENKYLYYIVHAHNIGIIATTIPIAKLMKLSWFYKIIKYSVSKLEF